MTKPWRPDVEAPASLAQRLIEAQFPALAPARLVSVGAGWDNAAWLVNDRWVFRFPRRQVAAGLLETEERALPLLAPHLPLPVPAPQFAGQPSDGYPYSFAGYALLPGYTACRLFASGAATRQCAKPLGRFLAALHTVAAGPEVRAWAPGDSIRRAARAYRAPAMKRRFSELAAVAPEVDSAGLAREIDRLLGAREHPGAPVWVHGDLYPRHVLVDESGLPCGVIDWGDVHLGDPALDLSIAHTLLPAESYPEFRSAYGGVDDDAWARARFRALSYASYLYPFALDTGDAALRACSRFILGEAGFLRALTD